jgi:hypothetical protein
MHAQLDDLLTATYVLVDDFLPKREAPAGRRGSRTPSSSSRWRSPKSSWDCRTTASFWRSPATGSRTCSPTCHVSRATTSVCALRARPGKCSEREVAREMLERVPLAGLTVIADKGFAGAEFEGWMADRGAEFLRPDRKDEPLHSDRSGACASESNRSFGPARDSSASSATAPAHSRACAPASGCGSSPSPPALRHDAEIGQPGRCFSAYGH